MAHYFRQLERCVSPRVRDQGIRAPFDQVLHNVQPSLLRGLVQWRSQAKRHLHQVVLDTILELDVVDDCTAVQEKVQYLQAIGLLSVYSVLQELSVSRTSAIMEKKFDGCEGGRITAKERAVQSKKPASASGLAP